MRRPWPALGRSTAENKSTLLITQNSADLISFPVEARNQALYCYVYLLQIKRPVHVTFFQEFDHTHLYIINIVFR